MLIEIGLFAIGAATGGGIVWEWQRREYDTKKDRWIEKHKKMCEIQEGLLDLISEARGVIIKIEALANSAARVRTTRIKAILDGEEKA